MISKFVCNRKSMLNTNRNESSETKNRNVSKNMKNYIWVNSQNYFVGDGFYNVETEWLWRGTGFKDCCIRRSLTKTIYF